MNISFLQFFNTKDRKILPLFEKASANLIYMSNVLVEFVSSDSIDKKKELFLEIERLEKVGEAITQKVFYELRSSLITPFDREDLHELISAIRNVADYIHGSLKRMQLYKIEQITPPIIKLSELIQKATNELHQAVAALHTIKNITKIKEATIKINSIENHADDVFDTALVKLLQEEKNMIEVIKIKDILTSLETATDMCEDAASVINSILVKNT